MPFGRGERSRPHQVVIRADAKQLSEVAESDGRVRLEPEVGVVVRWGEVAAFAVAREEEENTENSSNSLFSNSKRFPPTELLL